VRLSIYFPPFLIRNSAVPCTNDKHNLDAAEEGNKIRGFYFYESGLGFHLLGTYRVARFFSVQHTKSGEKITK
jgi:hypothetical protein